MPYGLSTNSFLLYPTFTYSRAENYLNLFKKNEWDFVKKHPVPKHVGKKTEIKYFAEVINVIEKDPKNLGKYPIWDRSHVKNYIKHRTPKIWILRVYELKKPYLAEQNKAILYVKLKKGVNVEESKPVINYKKFTKLSDEILNKI